MLDFTHPPLPVRPALILSLLFLPLAAQPRIGHVEVFGAYKSPKDKILRAVGVKAGDPLPRSKGDLEEKIEAIGGIVRARVEAWCCDEGNPILYLGVEERGGPVFLSRNLTVEDVELPAEVIQVYTEFAGALARAVAAKDTEEDLTDGHSLMANLPCRVLQERFLGLAEIHEQTLRRVLLGSPEAEQRAVAAYVYGYAPDKAALVPALQLALQDPDESVRVNAARALRAIAVYARSETSAKDIKLAPTWFIEMLNSLALQDRLEAAQTLLYLLDGTQAEAVVAGIKERALPALFDMARWRYLPHALPAFLLLGRLTGQEEVDLMRLWVQDRNKALLSFHKSLIKK
jgi:hypothetical protein